MAHAVCGEVELDAAHLVEVPFGNASIYMMIFTQAVSLPHKCLFISLPFQIWLSVKVTISHTDGPSWVERKSHVKANKSQARVTDNMHLFPKPVFVLEAAGL